MSLWSWIKSWFRPAPPAPSPSPPEQPRRRRPRRRVRLHPLRRVREPQAATASRVLDKPYAFARPSLFGGFLDFTGDGSDIKLKRSGLPVFHTPQELAEWLRIPLGQLGWLVHRFAERQRAGTLPQSHYHYKWLRKRAGGERLIEIPKPKLRAAQDRVLREILDKVPPHAAAHGFVKKRSIRTNAAPHVGQRVLLRLDLENFYPSVGYSRIVAIFRSLGYCREAAIWLARLTTSSLPDEVYQRMHQSGVGGQWWAYSRRHLPQGAATSPALANLSAFSLDLRLAGLARKFGARYTRYADDLTFSGDERFLKSLAVFIPLAQKVIKLERFRFNNQKRRVLRSNQRQSVAGVVVNQKVNVSRKAFDELKATLVNCIRRGPRSQNRQQHPEFAEHLRGRIAHVTHLNAQKGQRLAALFRRIDWNR